MSWLRRSVIGLVIGIVTVATFKVSIAEEEPLTPARRQLLEREAAEFYQDGLRLFPAEPDTAIKHFRTAVEIAERLYPKGHGNLALSLQTLGTALSRNGRPDEAIPHLTRALKIWEEVLRGDPTDNENAADLGETANNLGAALLQLNRYPEAVLPCERAIQIEEKHFGTAHSASVQNLATAYIHTGRGEKAMPHLDRLLARQCAQLAGGLVIGNWGNPMAQAVMVHLLWSPQLIQEIPLVLHLIGNVHQSLRDPYRALAYHQSGYEWRRTVFPNRKNADLGVSLNYLAETYLILRRPDRALPHAKEARPILEAQFPKGDHEVAKCWGHLAAALAGLGRPGEGLMLAERALDLRERLYPGAPHPQVALGLNNLAVIYGIMGRPEEALPLLARAWEMNKQLYRTDKGPADHPDIAFSLDNIGWTYFALGNLEKSQCFIDQARGMRKRLYRSHAEWHPELATSLNGSGLIRAARKKPAEAIPFYRRCHDMREKLYPRKLFPDGHPLIAQPLANLGVAELASGRPDAAVRDLKQAVRVGEAVFPKDLFPAGSPGLAIDLYNYATALAAQGKTADALAECERCLRMSAAILRREGMNSLESDVLDFAARLPSIRDLYLLLATEAKQPADETYAVIFPNQGAVTQALFARRVPDTTPEIRALREKLICIRSELTGVRLRPTTDPNREPMVADLTEAAENAERELLANSLQPKDKGIPVLPDLASALDHRSAVFVDVIRHDDRGPDGKLVPHYTVFVIGGKGAVSRIPLGPGEPIDGLVNGWRQDQVDWSRPNVKAEERLGLEKQADGRAAKLRELMWDPVAKCLPANPGPDPMTVFLAVEGDLARFPLAALPDGQGFLLDRHLFMTTPGGPLLLERLLAKSAVGAENLLAVGGVDYGKSSEPRYRYLEGTRTEVGRLREIAGEKVVSLEGQKATTGEVRRALEQADAAHIGTHGEFREALLQGDLKRRKEYRESLRGVSLSAGVFPQQVGFGARTPLGYVGLAFAGANLQVDPDNGILTGEVVTGLKLQRLRLLVLSACETGLGANTDAEGVRGLQRAFHLAGCPVVIATLFAIDDDATVALVTAFWARVLDKKTPLLPDRALWEAQRLVSARPDLIPAIARGPGNDIVLVNPAKNTGQKPPGGRPVRAHPFLWAAFFGSEAGH